MALRVARGEEEVMVPSVSKGRLGVGRYERCWLLSARFFVIPSPGLRVGRVPGLLAKSFVFALTHDGLTRMYLYIATLHTLFCLFCCYR